jgi:hypothetical protein
MRISDEKINPGDGKSLAFISAAIPKISNDENSLNI